MSDDVAFQYAIKPNGTIVNADTGEPLAMEALEINIRAQFTTAALSGLTSNPDVMAELFADPKKSIQDVAAAAAAIGKACSIPLLEEFWDRQDYFHAAKTDIEAKQKAAKAANDDGKANGTPRLQ